MLNKKEQYRYHDRDDPDYYGISLIPFNISNSLNCDLGGAMPRHRSPALLLRKAEDFSSGDKHSKHMPLLTYLA